MRFDCSDLLFITFHRRDVNRRPAGGRSVFIKTKQANKSGLKFVAPVPLPPPSEFWPRDLRKNPLGDSTASVGVASETRCLPALKCRGATPGFADAQRSRTFPEPPPLNSSRRLVPDGRARKEERTAPIEELVFALLLMDCWHAGLQSLFIYLFPFFPDANPNSALQEKRKKQ